MDCRLRACVCSSQGRRLVQEEWRPVVGFELYYHVSNLGRMQSRRTQKIMKPSTVSNGYQACNMHKGDGTRQTMSLHRMVAQAFLPNPNNLPCINHKDEVRGNSRADNLEWCTQQYNASYSLTKIYCFRSPASGFTLFRNLAEFCRVHKLSSSCMSGVNSGRSKQHKGWRRAG